jgi:site-specific recombinase XerD
MFRTEDYLEAKRLGKRHAGQQASPSTLKAYRHAIARAEQLVGKRLAEFTPDDGDTLLTRMDEAGFSDAHKANILAGVRGAFAWAIGTKQFEGDNPVAGLSTPKINRKVPTILTEDELVRLFAAFDSPLYRTCFKLMYYGGLRINEAMTLRRDCVFENAIVILGKGNQQRRTLLTKDVMSELQEVMKTTEGPYVFSHRDTPMHHSMFNAAFVRARIKANLSDRLVPHNLRHTSATHMQRKGKNLAITQKFLGHARPETTAIYVQLADADMEEAHRLAFGV